MVVLALQRGLICGVYGCLGQMEGVAGYFDAGSVPGSNDLGAIVRDEEVFARDIVVCIGQPIGIVVADTEPHARAAARAVKVAYQDLPAVLSIDEAIAAGSYFEARRHYARLPPWTHALVPGFPAFGRRHPTVRGGYQRLPERLMLGGMVLLAVHALPAGGMRRA